MRKLMMIASSLAVVIAAQAVSYEAPKLFPESCGGVQVAFDVAHGRVWEHTACPTGGRGTRPRQVTACAEVAWDQDGKIVAGSVVTLWVQREIGTQYPHAEGCL